MNNEFIIYTEGNADEAIFRSIAERLYSEFNLPRNFIVKSRRKGGFLEVIKAIREHDAPCIGVVDKDKTPIHQNEINRFALCFSSSNYNIYYKIINEHYKYLIVIDPAIEKWLFNSALEAGIKPRECGIPDDFKLFVEIAKTASRKNKFVNLFKKIYKQGIRPFNRIVLLTYLMAYYHFIGNPRRGSGGGAN
ncbi:MAG: hypothetical protein ACOCX7_04750 [Bacteroidota bacterium]